MKIFDFLLRKGRYRDKKSIDEYLDNLQEQFDSWEKGEKLPKTEEMPQDDSKIDITPHIQRADIKIDNPMEFFDAMEVYYDQNQILGVYNSGVDTFQVGVDRNTNEIKPGDPVVMTNQGMVRPLVNEGAGMPIEYPHVFEELTESQKATLDEAKRRSKSSRPMIKQMRD